MPAIAPRAPNTSEEKEKIIRIIFSELYVSQNIVKYKVKRGFECFENRFVASGGPKRARTAYLLIANEALYQMSYGPPK